MYLQGPWALSELAKANPQLKVGTFALPATNDPADTKARVNVDMALSIPKGAAHPEQARRFIEFLFRPDNITAYNAENAAFSTLADAAPQTDERIAGLAGYVQDGRYYQGAGTYPAPPVSVESNLQTFTLNRDGAALLTRLDADWQRVAQRFAARGI
jgi:raffinose/stachyose/melibiose transport system substrate-binding protein